jgi:error-prone DNA polymerase
MLLTRDAITDHTPLIRSANGVMTAVFDKEDVEDMGLVKFDVLGLRAMSAISTALELHEQATGERLEVDDIPLDDPRIYDLICDGKTVGLFQVESPGQIALIARHQPRTFKDLIAQIALLRPGPLQGGMVHPYVRRSRGEEEVTFLHPSLEEVLKDTHGIIVYQESVLQVAHAFAGLSFEQADEFRRLMSRWRDPGEMAGMREVFVRGALETHPNCTVEVAEEVFRLVSQFVGYGFPKSHSAAFAKTVYQTAFLKAYHPAAYFAAVMQHRPGMYPLESLITEARWSGVKVLPPSLEHSSLGFSLEPHGRFPNGRPRLAIRLPLEGVNGVGVADARQLLLERTVKPFASLEDLWRRVRVSRDALESLAQAGTLESFGERREVLWGLGVLETQYGPPGGDSPLLETPAVTDLPDLKTLTALERASWDFRTLHASAGPHPIALLRPWLNRAGVTPIHRITFDRVTVAGLVVVRQRPPTAKGVVFITLEDETGRVQCVAHPGVWERISKQLKQPSLIVVGAVTRVGNWRGITVEQGFALEARVPGGRAGSPRA